MINILKNVKNMLGPGRLRQRYQYFKVSLSYFTPCIKKQTKPKQPSRQASITTPKLREWNEMFSLMFLFNKANLHVLLKDTFL